MSRLAIGTNTGGRKRNDDNAATFHLNDGTIGLLVADGHGEDGNHAARIAVEVIPQVIREGWNQGDVHQLIHDAFWSAHQDILRDYRTRDPSLHAMPPHQAVEGLMTERATKHEKVPVYYKHNTRDPTLRSYPDSGTTATLVLINPRKESLITAVVGDSDAYCVNNRGSVVSLSTRHTPAHQKEIERIQRDVLPFTGGKVQIRDGRLVIAEVGGDYQHSLEPSRALGHNYARLVGVDPTPEIVERKMGQMPRLVVVGSDGAWEAVSPTTLTRTLTLGHANDVMRSLMSIVQTFSDETEASDNATMALYYHEGNAERHSERTEASPALPTSFAQVPRKRIKNEAKSAAVQKREREIIRRHAPRKLVISLDPELRLTTRR